jgi:uncharacterized protein YjbI with pentapeptide repeats
LRAVPFRAVDFFAVDLRDVDLRDVDFREADFRAVDVRGDAERLDDDFRAPPAAFFVFLAPPLFVVRLRAPLVSPASRRCLFTVAAAICLARALLRPIFCSDSLMCSYWRARFRLFTPVGGISDLLGTRTSG